MISILDPLTRLAATPAAFRRAAIAALLALPMGLAAQAPAQAAQAGQLSFSLELRGAQATPVRQYRRGHHRGYNRGVLPPHRVARRLRHQGYFDPRRLTYIPQRQVYRVDAVTYRGQPVRLRVDARTGRTLRVRYLDDRRGRGQGRRGGRGGRRR